MTELCHSLVRVDCNSEQHPYGTYDRLAINKRLSSEADGLRQYEAKAEC